MWDGLADEYPWHDQDDGCPVIVQDPPAQEAEPGVSQKIRGQAEGASDQGGRELGRRGDGGSAELLECVALASSTAMDTAPATAAGSAAHLAEGGLVPSGRPGTRLRRSCRLRRRRSRRRRCGPKTLVGWMCRSPRRSGVSMAAATFVSCSVGRGRLVRSGQMNLPLIGANFLIRHVAAHEGSPPDHSLVAGSLMRGVAQFGRALPASLGATSTTSRRRCPCFGGVRRCSVRALSKAVSGSAQLSAAQICTLPDGFR